MEQVYPRLRRQARRIAAASPAPSFYHTCADTVALSRRCFASDPVVRQVRSIAAGRLDDSRGHGLPHSVKVALDAGAIMARECQRLHIPSDRVIEHVRYAHMAGLLHDIARSSDNHAVIGASDAREILNGFQIPSTAIASICHAIADHEAFQPHAPSGESDMDRMSGCLYDADKFRWGPDNFKITVWRMVIAAEVPIDVFKRRYPAAMARVDSIRHTFRTDTGKRFGPEFIDLGLAIGRQLAAEVTHPLNDTLDNSL